MLQVFIFVPICLFLAVMNLAYNNLLTNIRFRCKLGCKTVGVCCYDVPNFCFGFCCLKKLCTDRCFTWPTLLKWAFKAGVFGYSLYVVWEAEKILHAQQPTNLVTRLPKVKNDGTFLFVVLLVHVAQHILFLVARPILFIVYSILTCCCDKGREFGENETFDDCMISYKYIEHETEFRGGMQNHVVGMAEISYFRRMSSVAREGQQRHDELVARNEMSGSQIQRLSMKMATALNTKFNLSVSQMCCICSCEFLPGNNVAFLGCHPKHAIHDYCYESLMKFFQADASCPLCRMKVDTAKVTMKQMDQLKRGSIEGADPFGIEMASLQKQNMADVSATAQGLLYPSSGQIAQPISPEVSATIEQQREASVME